MNAARSTGVRAVVIAAWIRGDMLPKAIIEQAVPASVS
jgi:hypothetical protein